MNFEEPRIFSLVIYRLCKKQAYFFPFLVLENFQLKCVFILTAALFFHSTYHLLICCVIFLFIVFIILYPSECKHKEDRDFCMFLIKAMYSQHLKQCLTHSKDSLNKLPLLPLHINGLVNFLHLFKKYSLEVLYIHLSLLTYKSRLRILESFGIVSFHICLLI